MDGSIHPHKHLLYHYLKQREDGEFVRILEQTKDIFSLYSKNSINVYSFEEYEDRHGKTREVIKKLIKTYNNSEIVMTLVKANEKGNTCRGAL